MATYFVSRVEPGDFRLDPGDLRRRLAERWPAAQVRGEDTPADAYQLHWTIPGEGPTPLEGALDRAGDGVTVDGDLVDVAAFALWLAALAPPDAGLHLYDEGYGASVPLTAGTAEADLTEPFLD